VASSQNNGWRRRIAKQAYGVKWRTALWRAIMAPARENQRHANGMAQMAANKKCSESEHIAA